MKTKLYIVRHTQTIGNLECRLTGRKDYELSEDGKKYVEKLTDRLKNVNFDIAFSSTSGRAIKTIEPLTKMKGLEIIKSDKLCEMYFGIYDGWKWEDVNKINPAIRQTQIDINEIAGIPKQETTEELQNRMYNAIDEIVKENQGKTILIASHGVAIEAFIRKITNKKFSEDRKENSQKNTSVNIITYDSNTNKYEVELLNDLSHLIERGYNEIR